MGQRYPFSAFPNGWFVVATSEELQPKNAVPLHYFGRELVLFRTESGVAHLLDAYCPHLGAHLGYGGKVVGECVRCPFHAWSFDGAGTCTEVPYAKKIPPRARIHPWTVREQNGLILAYHHADGQAPSHELPLLPEHGSEEWTPFQQQRWKVRMHCQEVGENAADVAHQRFLHLTGAVPEVLEFRDAGPVFELRTKMPGMRTHVTMYGLGAEVFRGRLHLSTRPPSGVNGENEANGEKTPTGPVDCLDAIFTTPIDEDFVDMRHIFSVKRCATEEETAVAESSWIKTAADGVADDIRIWERKAYRQPPMLCDGDGPIGQFRRWARQFYSNEESHERNRSAFLQPV
jgi:nitrite reductase/ring-hydroxylating ferredoxin subunit